MLLCHAVTRVKRIQTPSHILLLPMILPGLLLALDLLLLLLLMMMIQSAPCCCWPLLLTIQRPSPWAHCSLLLTPEGEGRPVLMLARLCYLGGTDTVLP